MVLLLMALRTPGQELESTQAALASVVVDVVQQAPGVAPPAPQQAPAPGEVATRQGGVTFSVRQVEPSYTVVSGDSLSAIAQRYGTSAEALQGINNLPDSFLRVNQRLVLPNQ